MPGGKAVTDITLQAIADRLGSRPSRRAETGGRVEAAVALIVVVPPGGAAELLFIKRAVREGDPWSGQMALPGGRRDPGDADLLATARRETLEETAVSLPAQGLLGDLDDLRPVTPHLPPIVVRPFVFGLTRRPPVKASEEVALHLWVPRNDLAGHRIEAPIRLRGEDRMVPGYRIGPHLIWGMTERILTPFLTLIAEARGPS